jgi:hypothetical protein
LAARIAMFNEQKFQGALRLGGGENAEAKSTPTTTFEGIEKTSQPLIKLGLTYLEN